MTIVVGALCANGVVIASDGMLTMGYPGQLPFAGFDNLKTHIINGKLIVSSAGSDKVMNIFLDFLHTKVDTIFAEDYLTSFDLCTAIHSEYLNYINTNFAKYPAIFLINNKLSSEIQNEFSAVLAFKFNGAHYLYRFFGCNSPEQIKPDSGLWYTMIGCGETQAIPLMQLIIKLLNIEPVPQVDKVINLLYWTVAQVIESGAAGVGGKITIAKLHDINGQYVFEYVDTYGADEFIDDFVQHVSQFRCSLIENSAVEVAPKFT